MLFDTRRRCRHAAASRSFDFAARRHYDAADAEPPLPFAMIATPLRFAAIDAAMSA